MARRPAHASVPALSGTVTIAGGGLAGLSLAAGLRLRGVDVTVHEAGSYPRHRVCGEFISGVEMETLEALGIAEALADAQSMRSVAWFREGRKIHDDELPEPALGISRYRLDARLKERVISLGGAVEDRSRLARDAKEGLVWAAGRIPQRGPWIGLKAHFHHLDMAAGLEMHLGANGYVGLAVVEDGRVNVCGLFRVDRALAGQGTGLLGCYLRAGGNGKLADRLEAAVIDEPSFCAVAGFKLGRQPVEPGLCTVGDAESMIPPFTGNGMSMAFQSAAMALDPLESWSRGRLSWPSCVAEIGGLQHRRFRRRLLAAGALHPILLRRGGRDVIESIAAAGLLPFRPLFALVR